MRFPDAVFLATLSIAAFKPALCEDRDKCKEIKQLVNGVEIKWPSTSSFVVSEPPCIGNDLEFVRRACKGGSWEYPEPACKFIQTPPTKCPVPFVKIKDKDLCIGYLPKDQFGGKCPFLDELPVPLPVQLDFSWLSIYRNDSDGTIGDYVSVEPPSDYGKLSWYPLNDFGQKFSGKQCLVYNTYRGLQTKAARCDERYVKACAYKTLTESDNTFCKEKFPGEKCIAGALGFTGSCVCLETQSEGVLHRSDFCEKLFEPLQPYQNLLGDFIDDEVCWIGLHKQNGRYIWSASKLEPNYTFWALDANFDSNFVALGERGWSTYPPRSLTCAICEKSVSFLKPQLTLKYNEQIWLFALRVENHDDLKMIDDESKHKVRCFFKSGQYEFNQLYPAKFTVNRERPHAIYTFNPDSNTGPAYYWCVAFSYPNFERIESNTIFVDNARYFGNEFIAIISSGYYPQGVSPLQPQFHKKLIGTLETNIHRQSVPFRVMLRRFKTLKIDERRRSIQYLFHLSIRRSDAWNGDLKIENSFLRSALNAASGGILDYRVDDFYPANYCFDEETTSNGFLLTWNVTKINEVALPLKPCLDGLGNLITRRCGGDFIHGARWSDVKDECHEEVPESKITSDLQSLLEDNKPPKDVVEALLKITSRHEIFKEIDVYLVSKVLRKIQQQQPVDLAKLTSIVSNVIMVERATLINSQSSYNATDEILASYDVFLKGFQNDTYKLARTENVILLIANLKATEISGLALFEKNRSLDVGLINTTSDINEIVARDDFQAAVYLDNALLETIKQTPYFNASHYLIVTAFLRDALFNELNERSYTLGTAFGVLLPDFYGNFSAPLSLLRKTPAGSSNTSCSHWKFERKSFWSESGLLAPINDSVLRCNFHHTTHFGVLILSHLKVLEVWVDFEALTVINAINCTLSFLGLMAIFVTAALFKSWRANRGNMILLNFSIAIALEIVTLYISKFVSANKNRQETLCLIAGVFLHYAVIAKFFWMLIVGYLQFNRLVLIFKVPKTRTLLKCCLIGWSFPLIPVAFLVALDPRSYVGSGFDLCYPSGVGFCLALFLPVALLLSANVIVFAVITFKIYKKGPECSANLKRELFVRWRMLIFLFFTLGITWVFGFLAYAGAVFLYLFDFLSPLQGFVLFLFFVVFNKSTRALYASLFNKKGR